MGRVIRVLQFADVINQHDFIDVIVQKADPGRFEVGTCVRTTASNIAVPTRRPGAPHWTLGGTSRLTLPRAVLQLLAVLRAWKVDILHSHHYDQAFIAWLATRLHRPTRHVLGRHYSDAIYRLPTGPKRRALLAIERLVNDAATSIIVPSGFIRNLLIERQRVPAEKIGVIPYGFEPRKYHEPSRSDTEQLRRVLGLEGRFVLATFARLHEEKGHRYLLEALARIAPRLPMLTLLLVGEGSERRAIERQIETAGLGGHVRLLGWRQDAMALMAAADAVVQPSLQEAFSQVMVEALWLRKPLVMTDVSGAMEVVHDGETGLLVPRGDADALVRAIERLVYDDELRARLADRGRAFVEESLSFDKIIPRYEQAYLWAAQA